MTFEMAMEEATDLEDMTGKVPSATRMGYHSIAEATGGNGSKKYQSCSGSHQVKDGKKRKYRKDRRNGY